MRAIGYVVFWIIAMLCGWIANQLAPTPQQFIVHRLRDALPWNRTPKTFDLTKVQAPPAEQPAPEQPAPSPSAPWTEKDSAGYTWSYRYDADGCKQIFANGEWRSADHAAWYQREWAAAQAKASRYSGGYRWSCSGGSCSRAPLFGGS